MKIVCYSIRNSLSGNSSRQQPQQKNQKQDKSRQEERKPHFDSILEIEIEKRKFDKKI